jgi:group I intron endonuclease
MTNGKRYIGSSAWLSRRLRQYFNISYLERNTCMYICRALLKDGYSNFSLEILEYCEVSERPPSGGRSALRAPQLKKEKYYFELLQPEYNISLDPTALFSGRNHTLSTKTKISVSKIGYKHSEESKQKMSDVQNSGRFKKGVSKPKPGGSGKPSQTIEVTDVQTNQKTTYDSMREAARALDIPCSAIPDYFRKNQKKPYKLRYVLREDIGGMLPTPWKRKN